MKNYTVKKVFNKIQLKKLFFNKNNLIFGLVFLFIIIFIACSGFITIKISGRIIGYNSKDSSSYQFKFYERHYKIDSLFVDSSGIYKMVVTFINVPPQCINLIKNGYKVDGYCLTDSNKQDVFINLFTGNRIQTTNLNKWGEHSVSNLDFNVMNILLNPNVNKFDSLEVSMFHNKNKFEFKVNDPSHSIVKITAYYRKSIWNYKEITMENSMFSLPDADFPKYNSNFENTLILYFYTKYGWYKAVRNVLWNVDENK